MTSNLETILELGVEGGSLTVERKTTAAGTRYRVRTSDQSECFLDDEAVAIERAGGWNARFEDALRACGHPWRRFAVLDVAPAYAERFAALAAEPQAPAVPRADPEPADAPAGGEGRTKRRGPRSAREIAAELAREARRRR